MKIKLYPNTILWYPAKRTLKVYARAHDYTEIVDTHGGFHTTTMSGTVYGEITVPNEGYTQVVRSYDPHEGNSVFLKPREFAVPYNKKQGLRLEFPIIEMGAYKAITFLSVPDFFVPVPHKDEGYVKREKACFLYGGFLKQDKPPRVETVRWKERGCKGANGERFVTKTLGEEVPIYYEGTLVDTFYVHPSMRIPFCINGKVHTTFTQAGDWHWIDALRMWRRWRDKCLLYSWRDCRIIKSVPLASLPRLWAEGR